MEHNRNVDNGVYKDEVCTKLLALASGVKDIDDPFFNRMQDPPGSPTPKSNMKKRKTPSFIKKSSIN